ncbi:unnamed protein product, partial [Tetraodon nigroviridis]
EVGRGSPVGDQHQAVSGQPAGPQHRGGPDVPGSGGVLHHQSHDQNRAETLQEGHGEDGVQVVLLQPLQRQVRRRLDGSRAPGASAVSFVSFSRFTEIKGGQTTEPDLLFSSDKDPSAYKEWLNTLPLIPDIISYSLNSLHELLPTSCPVRKDLRSAIRHYILEKGLWKNCSEPCQAGIRGTPGSPACVIYNNNNPHWAREVDLGTQDVSDEKKVRLEVWDQDNNWDDDLLGACQQVLTAGVQQEVCSLQHGRLFYSWKVECAPSLGGPGCTTYKPSPMAQSLRSAYVSRHAQPMPKAVLSEMGVFVSEGPAGNQSQSWARRRGFY